MSILRSQDPLLYEKVIDKLYSEDQYMDKVELLVTDKITPPYSISVNGEWGSGKTTLLILLKNRLEEKNYPVIWFNPWEYERTDDVVLAFLQLISFQFKKRFKLKDLGIFSLSFFTTSVDVAARFLSGGNISYSNTKEIVKDCEEAFKDEYEQYTNIIEKIKEDFSNLTQQIWQMNESKPLIVFFDDLDRCLPENAVKLLEALKNLFIVKDAKVIFITGIDTNIAKRFILKRYEGINEDFALNYFKKIFNLTINVPRLDPSQMSTFTNEYSESIFKDLNYRKDCILFKLSENLLLSIR